MSNYLSEAFKKLEILDEDVFDLDKDGLTALKDFEDKDEEDDSIAVIDPDAESEEDLEDSYIGKVILDCSVCHTDIYKDKEDITIDEEAGLANIGEECPYCYSSEGFKVIGEVKPFVETTFETDDDVEVEVDSEEVENEKEEEKNESLQEDTVKQGKYWVNKGDEGTHGKFRTKKAADAQRKAMFARGYKAEALEESCSINQCQKWVDYDMKKYKKISDDTMEKIKSSGYSVVKDQYGEYEVIADRKDESCGKRKPRKMKESIEDIKNNIYTVSIDYIPDSDYYNEADVINGASRYFNVSPQSIIVKHLHGPGGGYPEISISGTLSDLYRIILKYTDGDKEEALDILNHFSDVNIDVYDYFNELDKFLKESIEDITIDTGDQEITVSAKDKEEIESDGEMIAPLSDEVKADIEMDSDDIDVDVDEFSEEDFDELGESYLKKVYENVDSYRTTSAKTQGNKLYLEGLIKFNSGKEKKTSFVFESRTITKSGKAKLIGENLQISRGHKSFKLTGTINNGKFISESLNYNYRVKNGSESQRVYGTAKKSK